MSNPTYASAGVNIELGDDASKVLFEAAKKTWENRKGVLGEIVCPLEDFSGLRMINVSKLPEDTYMCMGFDGIGTKVEIAERIKKHDTMAFDLLAMVCDDAVVRGGEPILVGSVLDISTLGTEEHSFLEVVKDMAKGYYLAAKEANVAIINGEMAELGSRVGGYGNVNYNWSSAVLWFAKKDRLFTGKEIMMGDKIVALKEDGFRSNGFSLVRKILHSTHGEDWHINDFEGKTMGELALTPSRIYSKAVCEMFGGYDKEPKAEVHGVAHITGGGVSGKLGRILKASGLGAMISDPYDPPPFMLYVQQKGNIIDEEAYKTWNMGQGMLVVSPEPEKVVNIAKSHKIDAKVVGEVTKEAGIRIKSRGIWEKDKEMKF